MPMPEKILIDDSVFHAQARHRNLSLPCEGRWDLFDDEVINGVPTYIEGVPAVIDQVPQLDADGSERALSAVERNARQQQHSAAAAICRSCPHFLACLQDATRSDVATGARGIRAGLVPRQRRLLRKHLGIAQNAAAAAFNEQWSAHTTGRIIDEWRELLRGTAKSSKSRYPAPAVPPSAAAPTADRPAETASRYELLALCGAAAADPFTPAAAAAGFTPLQAAEFRSTLGLAADLTGRGFTDAWEDLPLSAVLTARASALAGPVTGANRHAKVQGFPAPAAIRSRPTHRAAVHPAVQHGSLVKQPSKYRAA